MLTNRMGLPEAIVRAVQNDPYSRGASRISVTSLITPPYQRLLKERHADELSEDVADRIYALVGQVGHGILERAYPELHTEEARAMTVEQCLATHGRAVERRLFSVIEDWIVSGQFDELAVEAGGNCLMDYKFTSVYAVMGETKQEWEYQLNFLRLLAIREGINVHRLRIIAILRDWSKGKSKNGGDYPVSQVVPVDIPVWPVEITEQRMRERVLAHKAETPPPCTDEERWAKPTVWAVMKDGRKSAVKLHDGHSIALRHAAELGKGHSVVHRPGEFTRCQDYCSVNHLCPQFKGEAIF